MRVCDKCETNQIYTTFFNRRDSSEFDICADCYEILSKWMYDPDKKIENDPVVYTPLEDSSAPTEIRIPKKEVKKRGKRTKR